MATGWLWDDLNNSEPTMSDRTLAGLTLFATACILFGFAAIWAVAALSVDVPV